YKPEPNVKPDKYAVIYVGHSDDLSAERFPFQHPRAHCWVKRAGSKWKVYICTYEVPGGGRPHRGQIARELTAIYQPRCNDQQFDQAWKDEWIGGTTASSPGLAKDPSRPEGALAGKIPCRYGPCQTGPERPSGLQAMPGDDDVRIAIRREHGVRDPRPGGR